MLALDLFEIAQTTAQPTQPSSDIEIKKNAAVIFTTMKNAYLRDQPLVTLEWPGSPAVTLTRNQLYSIFKKVYSVKSQEKRTALFTPIFGDRNKFVDLLTSIKVQARPTTSVPTPPEQMPLDLRMASPERFYKTKVKEEKKSSDHQTKTPYKDVRVQRAMRQARAEYPTAGSDIEAFAKGMLDAQDQDQQDISRLKSGLQKQRELVQRNANVDQDQERTISSIRAEVDKVDQENSDLASIIQKMQTANASLQRTLDTMKGRKPVPAPVAAPELPAVEPVSLPTSAPTVIPAATPATVLTPAQAEPRAKSGRKKGELSQTASAVKQREKRAAAKMAKDITSKAGKGAKVIPIDTKRAKKKEPEPVDDLGGLFGDELMKVGESSKMSRLEEMLTVQRFTESLQPGEYHIAHVILDDGTLHDIRVPFDEGYRDVITDHFARRGRQVKTIEMDWGVYSAERPYRKIQETVVPINNITDYRQQRAKMFDLLARKDLSPADRDVLKRQLRDLEQQAQSKGLTK